MSACAYAMAIPAIKNPADAIAFMIRLFELRHPHGRDALLDLKPSLSFDFNFCARDCGYESHVLCPAHMSQPCLAQSDAITHGPDSTIYRPKCSTIRQCCGTPSGRSGG